MQQNSTRAIQNPKGWCHQGVVYLIQHLLYLIWYICSIYQQIWKTQKWPQDWKRSTLIPTSKKGSNKEHSNHCTIALISHTSKVMLKILQVRLQQYVNRELPDVQAGFRKNKGTRDQIANIPLDHQKSKRIPEKNIYFCFTDYAKAFDLCGW